MARKPVGRPPVRIQAITKSMKEDWISGKEAGTRLPSEAALAKQYKVSRPTIRAALVMLERDKRIVRRAATGAFVSRYWQIQREDFHGKTIAVSFGKTHGSLSDRFLVSVLRGFQQSLEPVPSALQIETHDYRSHWAKPAAYYFDHDHIRAFFLLGAHSKKALESLLTVKKPNVAIDFDGTPFGMHSFMFDNHHGGKLLARRLDLLGHRRIAAIFESPDKPSEKQDDAWRMRRDGFQQEWIKRKKPDADYLYIDGRSITTEVLNAVVKLMKQPVFKRPTALVVPSDFQIWILREKLAKENLSIPKDLTLVGFGDWQENPELTAIRFHGADLGRRASECMLNLICNPETASSKPTLHQIRGRYVAGHTHTKG